MTYFHSCRERDMSYCLLSSDANIMFLIQATNLNVRNVPHLALKIFAFIQELTQ